MAPTSGNENSLLPSFAAVNSGFQPPALSVPLPAPGVGPCGAAVGDAFFPSWSGDGPGGHPAEVTPPRCPPAHSPHREGTSAVAQPPWGWGRGAAAQAPSCADLCMNQEAVESTRVGMFKPGFARFRPSHILRVRAVPPPARGAAVPPAVPCDCVLVPLPPRCVCSGT